MDFDLNSINVGDRVWRPVMVIPSMPEPVNKVITVTFKETDQGSWMCRIFKDEHLTDRTKLFAQDYNQGMVCFLKEPPPEDWTILMVTGKSKNGKAVFAKAVVGDWQELLDMYDLEVAA